MKNEKKYVILESNYIGLPAIVIFLGLLVILLLTTQSLNAYVRYAIWSIVIILWLMYLIRRTKYYPDKVEVFFPFRFKKVVIYLGPAHTIVYHNIKVRNQSASLYFVNSKYSKGKQIRESLLYGIGAPDEDEVISYVSEIMRYNIQIKVKMLKKDFPEFIQKLKLKSPNIIVNGDTISLPSGE